MDCTKITVCSLINSNDVHDNKDYNEVFLFMLTPASHLPELELMGVFPFFITVSIRLKYRP